MSAAYNYETQQWETGPAAATLRQRQDADTRQLLDGPRGAEFAAFIAKPARLAVRFGRSKRLVAVASIRAASEAWEKLRDENNLGASQSPQVTVIDTDTGKAACRISYNGRAWAMDGTEVAL